ncbi:hypothetical protein HAX54_013541 [Datura stramonium]|uniref:Uncharacterized protein n=1 Tax=Datura stramonium TaxID=4076 RepID=A0ABS8RZ28_DATST|nr:hypothetical protein [Datura stramonium]
MHASFIRPGGVAQNLPLGLCIDIDCGSLPIVNKIFDFYIDASKAGRGSTKGGRCGGGTKTLSEIEIFFFYHRKRSTEHILSYYIYKWSAYCLTGGKFDENNCKIAEADQGGNFILLKMRISIGMARIRGGSNRAQGKPIYKGLEPPAKVVKAADRTISTPTAVQTRRSKRQVQRKNAQVVESEEVEDGEKAKSGSQSEQEIREVSVTPPAQAVTELPTVFTPLNNRNNYENEQNSKGC